MEKINLALRSPLGKIFLVAVFLKIFLLPFFFHPDLKTIFCKAQYFGRGVVNIYEYLDRNKEIKEICSEFSYPPLNYYSLGVMYPALNFFGGNGFSQWLMIGNTSVDINHLFRFLFIIKIPFLIFEFLTAVLIVKFLDNEEQKRNALLIWFFNPANIYIVTVMGQLDIVPAFLSLLAIYLTFKKRRSYLGAFVLGLSAALKSYSLFFLPFYGIIVGKNWYQRFLLIIIGLTPYLVSVIPFVGFESFRQSVLLSGLSQRMFQLSWPIGFGEQIQLVLLAICFLFLRALIVKLDQEDLVTHFGSIALLFLAGSHFHPQWFIWSLPFLSILVAKSPKLIPALILLIIGWIGVILMYDDPALVFGLISPLEPSVFSLPSLRNLMANIIDPSQIQSMFHTLFTASSLWIIYSLIINEHDQTK